MDQTEPPIVPDKITPLLSDEEHHAVLVIRSSKTFMDRRDTAIILLLIDTGLGVSEPAGHRPRWCDTMAEKQPRSAHSKSKRHLGLPII